MLKAIAIFEAEGGGGVSSLNSLTGALSLTSVGGTITITPSGSTINLEASAGSSVAFNALTSGTNTSAAMVVGSGATLAASGTGTITATAAPASGLTGATLASNVVTSSLTSVGTLTGGATGTGFTVNLTASTISGTLPAANLPNPTATTLGGIESYAAISHQWINAISTSGVPSSTQPAFTDISGTIGNGQVSGSYTGITGVGTLTAGTWNATAIGPTYIVTGTSGANIPLLNGNLTFSGNNTFSGTTNEFTGGQVYANEYNNGNITGNVTINWNNGNKQYGTMTGNVTLTFSNPEPGATYRLALAGAYGYTLPTNVRTAGNVTITPTATAGKKDILYFDYCGVESLYDVVPSQAFAIT